MAPVRRIFRRTCMSVSRMRAACMSVRKGSEMESQRAVTAAKDSIYDVLRNKIIHFELIPGEQLSENSLASELSVSRTPIRDALSRLEDEGCVVVFPHRGTQVSRISQERIRQALFFRISLEQKVISELCLKGLTDEERSLLEESMKEQHRLYDRLAYSELLEEDMRMHRMLYCFTGHEKAWNAYVLVNCDLMRVLYLQIRTFSFKTTMSAVESWENSLTEHRMMLEMIMKRDREAVMLLTSRHLGDIYWRSDTLKRIFPDYFSEQESPV